ncbi:ATP-binding cassette transporter [Coprinellus micaceus]|uniref:ATP-binding cassette transporter n=1 Tax=Coprinellus micaceus TaxID=71717 RepID=A0A4Y7TAN2_COPMI|nr:ATP-binding cassette transporter [Coprinellus micaceus]
MPSPLLELLNVSCSVESGNVLFDDVNVKVYEGDILVLQGKSGGGKSTLLKCIGHLIAHDGHIVYRGRTSLQVGIPLYRTKVLYVPQRPSLLPGNPADFLKHILNLSIHQAHLKETESDYRLVHKQAVEIAHEWGISQELWERNWTQLSGGEAQRLLLSVAVAIDTAEVLLLDEPTSALDPDSSLLVEQCLVDRINSGQSNLKALIWITHSSEQGRRIGTRFVYMSGAGVWCSGALDGSAPFRYDKLGDKLWRRSAI